MRSSAFILYKVADNARAARVSTVGDKDVHSCDSESYLTLQHTANAVSLAPSHPADTDVSVASGMN